MAGLQGAGKTTTAGKLAKYLQERHKKKVMLVSADVYRPAAIKQLEQVAGQVGAQFVQSTTDEDPIAIATRAIEQAKLQYQDILIIDTAGRLHIDDAMMDEIKGLTAAVNPSETLFVVDSMTGQDAANTAKAFNDALPLTGVILTKTDGDARGGAALSVRAITEKPIKFLGRGEKLDALEPFHPDRMASRILGMGDLLTLIDKARKEFDEKKALEVTEKMRANTFDFNDFIEQLDQMMNMGPLEDLIKMIPGMSQIPGMNNIEIDHKEIARKRAMILSMTEEERQNPDLLNPSRRRRIARGSGNSEIEVNRMIKQFKQSRKMMSDMTKGNMPKEFESMFGQGVKGKIGKAVMSREMKKMNKKLQKNKKKRKKKK